MKEADISYKRPSKGGKGGGGGREGEGGVRGEGGGGEERLLFNSTGTEC